MDAEKENFEFEDTLEFPPPVVRGETELILKIKNVALRLMRKTGYTAQFESLQKTDFLNEIFLDEAICQKFNNFNYQNPVDYEEFIKLCTISIKNAIYDHLRRKFSKKRRNETEDVSLDEYLDLSLIPDQNVNSPERELIIVETWKRFKREYQKNHKNLSEIVDYKFIYGFTNEEIVTLISKNNPISLSTVEKTLRLARDWFASELRDE